ncbi:MAG: MFS transporter [Thermoflexales bacterium]|nr:MFS transporter [Thermoflexales bacterium]
MLYSLDDLLTLGLGMIGTRLVNRVALALTHISNERLAVIIIGRFVIGLAVGLGNILCPCIFIQIAMAPNWPAMAANQPHAQRATTARQTSPM